MPLSRPIHHIVLALPAYNEAAGIGALLDQAVEVLRSQDLDWDLIVVDDGSTDGTAEIVERAAAAHPSIRLVRHERNLGLGPAILTALKTAARLAPGDESLLVCMDADLTHSPSVIPAMRAAAEQGADVVIASRFHPMSRVVGVGLFRRLLSWGARRVFSMALGLPGVLDYTCGFRAIRIGLVERALERFGEQGLITRRGFACTDELLVKLALLGPVIREVPFTLRYDLKRGASKIDLRVTLVETIRLVIWARRELRMARRSSHDG